jgi:hypothetical protein
MADMALDTFGSITPTEQDRIDLADHLTGAAVRWINERFEVGLRDMRRARDLEVGDLFIAPNGLGVYKVTEAPPEYVNTRCEQFSNVLIFYDPATAAKAGAFSWNREVEVIGAR